MKINRYCLGGECLVVITALSVANLFPVASLAQGPYTLPPDRVTLWSAAGLTYNGGIPSSDWPIYKTITCKNTTADLNTIQRAVDSGHATYPSGVVIALATGACNFNAGFVLVPSNTAVRGAGAGLTTISITNGAQPQNDAPGQHNAPAFIIGPARYLSSQPGSPNTGTRRSTLLKATAHQGDYSVQVAKFSYFHAGDFVLLDEASGASWQPDLAKSARSVLASSDYRVVYQAHQPADQYVDDPVAYPATPSASNNYAGAGNGNDAASWFSRQDRLSSETKQIASCGATAAGAACTSTTITFTTPVVAAGYRANAPHFAELTSYSAPFVVHGGVESLTVTGADDDAIDMQWCGGCWVRNVEVTQWLGHGVGMYSTFGVELRDSYIHDADWPVPGGGGYAIALSQSSAAALIENNIMVRANKVMVAQAGGAGSVIAYNYADDGMIGSSANEEPGNQGWIEIGLNASHMVGPNHVLFEGNWAFNADSDTTHGNSIYNVYFRNYLRGWRTTFTSPIDGITYQDVDLRSGPYRAAGVMSYSFWFSFVGNVLGAPGMNGLVWAYDDRTAFVDGMPTVWMLGWNAVNSESGKNGYFTVSRAEATAIRDGNFDWLNQAQCWHGLGGTGPCNTTTPSDSVLPDSLYLSGAPAFFGSNPWPWVDPTAGTIDTLPAKARYDAGTPNVLR